MIRFLLCLLLVVPAALNAQDNPDYNPDFNGDGCYSVADILGLLPLFGSCEPQPFQCGDSMFFDGYGYETVLIGDQCWFAENLRTTVYADGTVIPADLTVEEWISTTSGATAVYGEDSGCDDLSPDIEACDEAQSLAEYGRLYNWYAVDDARGLCPSGWHVPTDVEWTDLENYITSQGFFGTEGTTLKSTTGWATYNWVDGNGTDDFGFSALPGGYRSWAYDGWFGDAGSYGTWWSSSLTGLVSCGWGSAAWTRYLYDTDPGIYRHQDWPSQGSSVRCIRDADIPEVQGCTDPAYLEYNEAATVDDGSCATIGGCTDPAYLEYNAEANTDDGSCSTLANAGCTNPAYIEYDPAANVDDGSCLNLMGCTDPAYLEYDEAATVDDGSCTTLVDFNCVPPTMDGYDYDVVQIGDQCWFAENLRTTVYANGDVIPAGLIDGEWTSTSTTAGATTVYGEGSSHCVNSILYIDACDEAQSLAEYGRLYNWFAVDDARGLCPLGWHVPTDGEWMVLEMELGMSESEAISEGWRGTDQGTQLKSTSGWYCDGNGSDDFGFSALPGGRRASNNGNFAWGGNLGHWWSSSPSPSASFIRAWTRYLSGSNPNINRGSANPQYGVSIRCLLNAPPLQGCTDSSYIEFNPSAVLDDGSCLTPVAPGCTDSLDVEYDPAANVDDGSCLNLMGCTDSAYLEYTSAATIDDGSCTTLVDVNCVPPTMDGYEYDVLQIGDQCWFAENLRTTVYGNGDIIPAGLTDGEWLSTTAGATAIYGEGSSPCYEYSPYIDACDEAQSLAAYGRLYNWYAVDDERGLCPAGWHVPTDGEWTGLEDYITSQGFAGTEGTALKSTTGWYYNLNGTDDFGFSALPGGLRYSNGFFNKAGDYGSWWSSSPSGSPVWTRYLYSNNPDFLRAYSNSHQQGLSVRCLRDAE